MLHYKLVKSKSTKKNRILGNQPMLIIIRLKLLVLLLLAASIASASNVPIDNANCGIVSGQLTGGVDSYGYLDYINPADQTKLAGSEVISMTLSSKRAIIGITVQISMKANLLGERKTSRTGTSFMKPKSQPVLSSNIKSKIPTATTKKGVNTLARDRSRRREPIMPISKTAKPKCTSIVLRYWLP